MTGELSGDQRYKMEALSDQKQSVSHYQDEEKSLKNCRRYTRGIILLHPLLKSVLCLS